MWKVLTIFTILSVYSGGIKCEVFRELFKWKQVEFQLQNSVSSATPDIIFPEDLEYYRQKEKEKRLEVGSKINYTAYNNVPMGVTHYKGRLFVTIPRRRTGIPSTLNYITISPLPPTSSPKLIPYPNFKMNNIHEETNDLQNNKKIISVYRTRADICNRLWFVDTGRLEYPDNPIQVQQPSIWIIDLETNEVIRRYEISESVVNDGRGLASITVDVDKSNCDNTFAYIPDLFSRAIYVYNLQTNRIWTFRHNYFSFDPLQGDLKIGGQEFQWDDGIFSITLGKRNENGFKNAYFHPMISISEFYVSTKVLQNESNAQRPYHGDDFKHLGIRGENRQSTMHDIDPKTNIIMYAEIQKSGIGCWNTNKKFSPENHFTIQKNEKTMIYPSDLTIDSDGVAWVMTNSMPIFIYSTLDPNEYNFRIWTQSVLKATEGTVCSPKN